MNKLTLSVFLFISILISCNQPATVSKKDALESARGFIESSLKGDYNDAQQYLLQDSTNMQYFEGFKEFYSKQTDAEKDGYANANIIIDSTQQLSDSVSIVTYSNTFKNKPSSLKMIKKDNEWLVDFKYTFAKGQY